MTESEDKVYEETYKGRLIEIYCHSPSDSGDTESSYFTIRVDDESLPGEFDKNTQNQFRAARDTGCLPDPKESMALTFAKAYCDNYPGT